MDYSILKIIRRQNKMKIIELAQKTGIHRETLSNIERGKNNTDVRSLEKICKVFDLELQIITKA